MSVYLVALDAPMARYETEDLGIAYLAAVLEQRGHEVHVMDQIKTSLTDAEIIEQILETKPNLVGYSENGNDLQRVIHMANAIRAQFPGAFQIIGDRTASFYADEILQEAPGFDAVCIGEGELTLLEAVERINTGGSLDKVPGLLTRTGGRANFRPRAKIADITTLPWPKRYVLPFLSDQEKKSIFCTILGSRGCVYQCNFCGSEPWEKLNSGDNWRARDVIDLVDEMEFIVQTYGVRRFSFLDALWTGPPSPHSKERLHRFCEEILKRHLEVTFVLLSRADFFEADADQELVQNLNAAGLRNIFIGVENGSAATLEFFGKGGRLSPEQMEHDLHWLRENGTHVSIGFIMFHPFVTLEELETNVEFLRRLKFNHFMAHYANRARIFRHCRLYPIVKQAGLFHPSPRWGEQTYDFAVPGIAQIYSRVLAVAKELGDLDGQLDNLLSRLWYGGKSGQTLAELLQKKICQTYNLIWEQILRREMPPQEILNRRQEIMDMINITRSYIVKE